MNSQQRELTPDRYVRLEQPKPPEETKIQDHEVRALPAVSSASTRILCHKAI